MVPRGRQPTAAAQQSTRHLGIRTLRSRALRMNLARTILRFPLIARLLSPLHRKRLCHMRQSINYYDTRDHMRINAAAYSICLLSGDALGVNAKRRTAPSALLG